MFSGYLFTLLSTLIFFSGIIFLVWNIFGGQSGDNSSGGNQDDEGGLAWDIDAPLDLPPGVYVLPPEPVGKA